MTSNKKMAPSRAWAAKLVHAALTILRDNGKALTMSVVFSKVGESSKFDDWALHRYEKSGLLRWQSILSFYSIDCVKAGYIVKKKGVWYLTPEGEDALKLGPEKLLESIEEAYRKWREKHPKIGDGKDDEEEPPPPVISYEEVEQRAIEGLQQFINSKNAYEFQDLVAALLRGMGYYTPFVAPKGKDGGIDIVAYRDPLGTESPRIQVQIKHRESPASVQEIRQLMGLLQKQGDVGIFVSTAGFTSDGRNAARSSHVHVELIDLNRFIGLWQEFYEKLTEEDKGLMPLRPTYFLAPTE